MSSVIWSNQREPLTAQVGAAERNRRRLATHPLIQENQKLVPSITKVFRRDQNLYVYAEVYDAAMDTEQKTPSVSANLTFFRGKTKAFESEAVRVTEERSGRPHTVTLQFQIPLSKLKAGRYTCQLNVVDERGQKFAFRRSPLVLLPES
jgi:hypothetical protein